MTDYIPKGKRGRYFGWRNRILGMANVASMIMAGLLLYWTKEFSHLSGFFVIFFTLCYFAAFKR